MKTKLAVIVLASAVALSSSAYAGGPDINKAVKQIQQEVQGMSLEKLESNAKSYVEAIRAKKVELQKIGDQVKAIAPTELLSAKAKQIKSDFGKVQADISALTARYQVYARKFQEIGGDISKIKIG